MDHHLDDYPADRLHGNQSLDLQVYNAVSHEARDQRRGLQDS